MYPPYTKEKFKTAKIITANNTPGKRIISKIPFEYTHPSDHPPAGKMLADMRRFSLNIAQTKAFGDHGPLGEHTPRIKGEEREGEGRRKEMKGKMTGKRKRGERRTPPHPCHIFWQMRTG